MQQKNFWKSKLFIVLLVLLVFFFFVFKNPRGFFDPLQSFGQVVLAPVSHLGTILGYSVGSVGGVFQDINSLKEENRDLQKRNLELLAENASLLQLGNENIELRRNLELLPRSERQYIGASIVGRDPAGIQNFLTLDKGEDDGVRVGMPAVVETGVLVGKVTAVFSKSATVTLITNQESLVNVETTNAAVRGIVRGVHGINLVLDMVEQGKELKEGDTVVTSGLGGEYPPGLLVGTLSNLRLSEDTLFQQASVASPVRIGGLRFVFLIR